MTFPTIPAGQLASATLGDYANFIAYLNALSTAVDTNTSGLSGKAASSHTHALADVTGAPDVLTSGEATLPPGLCVAAGGGSAANQALRLTYFTATKTESITKISTYAATAAAATPTLCRIGIYSVAGNGDLALIVSTSTDTALWSSNSVEYEKALSGTFSKVAGTRYAIGALCVTGASAPTLAGCNGSNGLIMAIAPRTSGSVASQSDLPTSVAAGSIANTTIRQFFWLKP